MVNPASSPIKEMGKSGTSVVDINFIPEAF